MPYCRNCGVQLSENATLCPNCGEPVEVKTQFTPDIKKTALRCLVIGLVGSVLSMAINLFSGIDLYFIPSFVSSIFIIYTYRVNDFRESLIATFAVYLFTDGILGTLVLGQYYILNETYIFIPGFWDVALYPFNPISALIAAYVGVKISPKGRGKPVSVPRRREEGPGGVVYNL